MTTWNNVQKYSGQTGITYNQSGRTYNEVGYTYWGLLITIFSNISKTATTFTNLAKSAASTFTNQVKN